MDFPGHSEQEANYHEEWKITPNSSALDFTKPEVQEYMFAIYQEAANMFHADTIHIGGDEYFQSKYPGGEADKILSQWAQEQSGNSEANQYDALKLFFNQAAKPFLDKGINVLVWNDNIFSFDSAVDLDDRIVVDVWAGDIWFNHCI